MPRRVSLNARKAYEAQSSKEVEVVLITIEHDELDEPVRLSTDPTERLSEDPLIYCTRSSLMDADPETEPYLFLLAEVELPSDLEDAPAEARLILANLDASISNLLRSFLTPARVSVAVVLSTSPDLAEVLFTGLLLTGADGDASEISLTITRLPIEDESWPKDRMTKERFPGLHR